MAEDAARAAATGPAAMAAIRGNDDAAARDGAAKDDAAALASALAASGMHAAAAAIHAARLARRPADWRAMLALGDCRAAEGDPAAAAAQYRAAAALAPGEAAPLGRLREIGRILGEAVEAGGLLAREDGLDRAGGAAAGPGPAVRPSPADPSAARLVFDASDLIAYFEHNRAPTGIQRVQLNIIERALAAATAEEPVAVCAFDREAGAWRAIPAALFLGLCRLSRSGADPRDLAWRAALAELHEALAAAPDLAFAPGAVLCNLGTSWWIRDYFLRVRDAKARFGLRYVPFVHDCIPLIVPEHCAEGLVREFAQWFASLALHADALLCNSRCTAADARREIARLVPGLDLPSTVVPLDADLRGMVEEGGETGDPRLPSPGEPFVLFVGTIESRKDHLLAFRAWQALIRRHGGAAVPRLICVGKPGWLAEPALALLAGARDLAGRVAVLHGVPDTALAALYRRCLFTLYNSHYEGWGLPVTESLSYGRVPLVPRHSALVESGGEGAVFFAPGDADDLAAKLETLLFDPAARAAAEARIAARVWLRGWGAITDQILGALRALPPADSGAAAAASRAPAPHRAVALRPGAVMPLRLLGDLAPHPGLARADVARVGLGWHPLQSWGVWTRPGRARLELPLAAPTAVPMRLYLDCVMPAAAGALPVRLRLRRGAKAMPWAAPRAEPGERFLCVLDAPAGLDAIALEIDSGAEGAPPGPGAAPDGPRVGLGLAGLMLCRPDNLAARLEFLESRRFRFHPPPAPGGW